MKRTYYDLLGVPRNAPPEALREAYRALISRAASAPPDQAEALGNEVRLARRAFAELMHPAKRAAYDASLAAEARRERFLPGSAPYVPDRFRHDAGRWSRRTVWATVIAALVLVGIGTYARQLAGSHQEARAQQAAEEEARAEARRRADVLRARVSAPAQGVAPAPDSPGQAGR